jgi:serine/threonine-protein kinase
MQSPSGTRATAAYEPDTPAERGHIGLGAPSSHATTDVAAVLRRRLWFVNALLAVTSATIVLGFDAPRIALRGSVHAMVWVFAAQHLLAAVVATGLAVLLGGRRPLTIRQLRWIELPTLLPVLGHTVTDDLNTLLDHPLVDTWAAVYSLLPKGLSAVWLLAIVIYGTLIPNTWRRCAVVTTTFAAIPLCLVLGAEAYRGFPSPAYLLVEVLVAMTTLLGCAIPAIVFNVHRQEFLRNQVSEARQLGQYRLGRPLGAGGMGEVYRAEHRFLRRPCAIKLIRPERAVDPTNLARFEREVQATATLTHPNTVQIYDYGRADDGTFYYVMEYLPGLTLDQLVAGHGPLDPARAVHLLRQVCGALSEAHAIGLIHRDIKPGNVMVCARGGRHDVVKVLDFGLVLDRGGGDDKLTREGTVAGTPAYMSPEQAAGDPVDHRADVYAVGAVGYFLLSGRAPFGAGSAMRTIAAVLTAAPEPLVGVPDELAGVVMRCLAKAPGERFPTADELDAALAGCGCGGWSHRQAADWWAGARGGPSEPGQDTGTFATPGDPPDPTRTFATGPM